MNQSIKNGPNPDDWDVRPQGSKFVAWLVRNIGVPLAWFLLIALVMGAIAFGGYREGMIWGCW